ncbi:Uncharacterised protein [Bordetella trematum]|nr:Uncharacterised protein [Bordetella trematum]
MTDIADEVLDAPAKIKQYSPIEAGLAKLREQFAGVVFDVTTTKGLEDAKAARQAIRAPRYELEKARKALKAPPWSIPSASTARPSASRPSCWRSKPRWMKPSKPKRPARKKSRQPRRGKI